MSINNLSKIIGRGMFETKHNNGRREHYTNSCMWISIHDYLIEIMGSKITLKQLRDIGTADDEKDINEMFDSINPRYVNGLENICEVFGINIKIYTYNNRSDKLILSDMYPAAHIGSSDSNRQTIHIFSRGLHFALIIHSEQLDKSDKSDNSDKSDKSKDDKQDLVYNTVTKSYINITELSAKLEEATDMVKKLSYKSKNTDLERATKRSLEDSIEKITVELTVAASIITSNNEASSRFIQNLKSEQKQIENTLNMLNNVGIHQTEHVYTDTLHKLDYITAMLNSLQ
jgi:hypothetical protein